MMICETDTQSKGDRRYIISQLNIKLGQRRFRASRCLESIISTKLIITRYKNVPNYAKKCGYKIFIQTQWYKDSPVPSSILRRKPQHNSVDAEWKSPLSNYLTELWGPVPLSWETYVSQPVNFNEILWKKWLLDKSRATYRQNPRPASSPCPWFKSQWWLT